MFDILIVVTPTTIDITQFLAQLNSIWIFQLLNGISHDIQKLLNYFSGKAIFAFLTTLLLPPATKSSNKLDLYLKDVELVVLTLTGTPC